MTLLSGCYAWFAEKCGNFRLRSVPPVAGRPSCVSSRNSGGAEQAPRFCGWNQRCHAIVGTLAYRHNDEPERTWAKVGVRIDEGRMA